MMRLIANILVLISVASLPYYITIVLCILCCFMFDFVEIIVYGLLFDILYSVPASFLASNAYILGAVCVYVIMLGIKPFIKI